MKAPDYHDFEAWPQWVGGGYSCAAPLAKFFLVIFIPMAAWSSINGGAGSILFVVGVPLTVALLTCLVALRAKLHRLWREAALRHAEDWLEKAHQSRSVLSFQKQREMSKFWSDGEAVWKGYLRRSLARRYNQPWMRLFRLRPEGWDRWRALEVNDFRMCEDLAAASGSADLFQTYLRWDILRQASELPLEIYRVPSQQIPDNS